MSNFNMMKTVTLSGHTGLIWCFHNSHDLQCAYVIFLREILMADLSLLSHPNDFCRFCTEFDTEEGSRWTQSLAHTVTHLCGDHA